MINSQPRSRPGAGDEQAWDVDCLVRCANHPETLLNWEGESTPIPTNRLTSIRIPVLEICGDIGDDEVSLEDFLSRTLHKWRYA